MKYLMSIALLRNNRNFRLLFIGQFVSLMGTMITSIVAPYQIYHETKSNLFVGLLSLAQLLPLMITALLGGVFADRYPRRQLLLISELLLAIGCLLLAVNVSLDTPNIAAIFIIAAFMSAITGIHRPALDSMMQQIVDKKDYHQLGALGAFKYSFCAIAGPALAGLIIAHFGAFVTFLVDFASFAVSLAAIFLIKNMPANPQPAQDYSIVKALKQGIQYAMSRQELLGTYSVDFIAMVFGMPTALFPAIASAHGGAKVLGMLYSAPAVGELLISFFSSWTSKVNRQGRAIALSAAVWGMTIVAFGCFIHINIWAALFFLSLSGAFDAVSGIFRQVIWNETIPTDYRGRLASLEMLSYLSGPKLGDTEAGLVAAAFGITASIVSGGVLCVIGVGACYYLMPTFRYYKSTLSLPLRSLNTNTNTNTNSHAPEN